MAINISDIELRPYQPGDESSILALFENAFQRTMSPDYWNWRFRDNPLQRTAIELAWHGDLLVSHYATTPVEMWIAGRSVLTALAGTTMTHTDYRGLNLFQLLGKQLYKRLPESDVELVWGFPNNNIHRSRVKHLDWFDTYEVPTFRVQLKQTNYAQPEQVIELQEFDARFDALWETAKHQFQVIGSRKADQLRWRYSNNSMEKYQIAVIESGDGLAGYIVYKQYKTELQIIDILTVNDEQIGTVLVQYVMAKAHQQGLTSVALWLSVFTNLHHSLERLGFYNDAPITYLGGRILTANNLELVKQYNGWYLMMGDSDVY